MEMKLAHISVFFFFCFFLSIERCKKIDIETDREKLAVAAVNHTSEMIIKW